MFGRLNEFLFGKNKNQKTEELIEGKEYRLEINNDPESIDMIDWLSDQPTSEVIKLVKLIEKSNQNIGTIIDTQAGYSKNTIYIATKFADIRNKKFKIMAVENDGLAVIDLKKQIWEHILNEEIEIVQNDITEFLQYVEKNSIMAVVDCGTSHGMDDEIGQEFTHQIHRILNPGGMVSVLHYSKKERSKKNMVTRGVNDLKKLYSPAKFMEEEPWQEINWKHQGLIHHAWTAVLKKRTQDEEKIM
ncbi:MAG: hypothetical protein WC570_04015 [Patescibacteria group bacterium]